MKTAEAWGGFHANGTDIIIINSYRGPDQTTGRWFGRSFRRRSRLLQFESFFSFSPGGSLYPPQSYPPHLFTATTDASSDSVRSFRVPVLGLPKFIAPRSGPVPELARALPARRAVLLFFDGLYYTLSDGSRHFFFSNGGGW